MLARLARFALALEIAAYLAVGYALHRFAGWPVAALVAAALGCAFGVRFLLVCFTCFVGGWLLRSARAPQDRLGPRATVGYVLGEYRALLADNLVNLPFDRLVLRADATSAGGGGIPVVLVHGYFSNRGFFRRLVPALEAAGVGPVFTPDFTVLLRTIEHFAAELHEEIERVVAATGSARVVLVCHSMGGLAARRYRADHGDARIARLVTIATPHHGTAMAAMGAGANARQMKPGSAFLRALEHHESAGPPAFPVLSIYSPHDNLVSPQATSVLAWARNLALPGLGHVAILGSQRLFAALRDELR
jgi:pimeloyl-ACP methyl ester carboxylesterase